MKFPLLSLVILLYTSTIYQIVNCYLSRSQFERRILPLQSIKTIVDLEKISTKEALINICGDFDQKQNKLFPRTTICKSSPTICQYIIANPITFYQNPKIALQYGVDVQNIPKSSSLEALADILPVIYLADNHPEYGMLGFILNKKSGMTMNDNNMYSGLRNLRNRPVYLGGTQNRGSSFTMVHRKAGFPENRIWKGLPGNTEFRLFFSPDIAMANELCSTKDALPTDFKFFQWATIWQPRQLELEYDKKLWITINGPIEILFEDDNEQFPLYKRIIASLSLLQSPSPNTSLQTTSKDIDSKIDSITTINGDDNNNTTNTNTNTTNEKTSYNDNNNIDRKSVPTINKQPTISKTTPPSTPQPNKYYF